MVFMSQLVRGTGGQWAVPRPILERGSAEVCMLERSVLFEPTEEKIGFGGVPSSSIFVGVFDVSVR